MRPISFVGATMLDAGFLQIGNPFMYNYDPVCFDCNLGIAEPRLIQLDHEAIRAMVKSALDHRYEYKGEVVYFVPPRCSDIWSDVYRADGSMLCHANGSMTGGGDGRCPDFLSERTTGQIIWQDPRGSR